MPTVATMTTTITSARIAKIRRGRSPRRPPPGTPAPRPPPPGRVRGTARWLPRGTARGLLRGVRAGGCSGQALPEPGRADADAPHESGGWPLPAP